MSLDQITEKDIADAVLMESLTSTEAGMKFLEWLCELCWWNRPVFNRNADFGRVIWSAVRLNIPVEKLAIIEYSKLKDQKSMIQQLLKDVQAEVDEEELEEDGR